MRKLLPIFAFLTIVSANFQAAYANKLTDCIKQVALTGGQLTDCLLSSSSSNNGNGQSSNQSNYQGQSYVCDISAEPKFQGDWSFQACSIPPQPGAQPGVQCTCQIAVSGRVYGGIVK